MIAFIWKELSSSVDGLRRRFMVLIMSAAIGGLAEAAALLIAVRVALDVNADDTGSIALPVVEVGLSIGAAVALAAICAGAALISHVAVAWQSALLGSAVLAQTRIAAVNRFVDAAWPTQALQREGALQETVTTLSQRSSQLIQSLATGATQAVTLLAFIAAALVVQPLATGAFVAAGLLIIAGMRPIAKATRRRARMFVNANSHYAEEVSRLTSTSMELRVFGVQREAERMLAETNDDVQRKQFRARFMMMFGSSLYKDLAVLLLVGCVGVLASVDRDAIAAIGVVVALVVRSLASAQQVNNAYQTINENAPNLEVLNQRLAVLVAGAAPSGHTPISQISTIELRDVGYHYTDHVQALSDVSVRLEHGEALGLIGPSGSGKSTLAQVLLRLRLPTEGKLLVDGIDYTDLDDEDWSNLLGFVPQEPTLLEATVAENIRYYRSISRDEVERAAIDANVYDDISQMPNGFDTMLGPRGAGLSGGQKQRVAIARALAGRPQVLVMDEPSSALDVHSERLLQDAIGQMKGRMIMVVIAHRMKTVESCDRLMVLEHGCVAQLGPPGDVIRSDGFYRSIQSGS